MKVFFNPKTKSVVLYHKKKYYDTRNGGEITIDGKLPVMLPYKRYTLSKPEEFKGRMPNFIPTLKVKVIKVDDKHQLGGNYPRYFWKGFAKIIKSVGI